MPTTKTIAAAFLLTGMAVANPLTTLEVCPAASTSVPACTVTAQHQSVSTCIPTATKGTSTGYSYSTWAYVSTVIPCGYDGKTISSCTVTKTDQAVPCSASATTITSIVPITTGFPSKNGTNATTSYSTSYQTISKQWAAPYNKLGPLAVPGFDGCELCTDCAVKGDGSRSQFYNVTECTSGSGKAVSCQNYAENRVSSKSAPASSTAATATNSIKTSVPSQGTYTFTFTNTAPAATITSDGQKITMPPQPWFNYETRSCQGPTNFDFTVTVTKTVTNYVPFSTSTGASKTPVDPTAAMHWGAWTGPAVTPAATTPANGPAGPTGASFYIPVNSGSGSKYSKSGNQWIGFPSGGDDGAVVSSKGDAASFYFDSDGNLMCDGQYISSSTNAGYLVFEKGGDKPSGPKFTIGGDGSFTLPGAGFCFTDSTFFITFAGSPSGCKPVTCSTNGGNQFTTSSTTVNTWTNGWGQWASATSTTFATSTSYGSTSTSTTSGSTTSSTTSMITTTSTVSGGITSSTASGSSTTSTLSGGITSSTATGSTTSSSATVAPITSATTTMTTSYSYTTTSTSTSEQSTTTTTSYDPSADLDILEPTAKPIPRKRGGVLRKRME